VVRSGEAERGSRPEEHTMDLADDCVVKERNTPMEPFGFCAHALEYQLSFPDHRSRAQELDDRDYWTTDVLTCPQYRRISTRVAGGGL
jgi:hypothetical protein